MSFLTKENEKDWRKACLIAGQALDYGKELVLPGAKVIEITENVEKFIFSKGGELGFPVNLSFNEVAAHNVAAYNDQHILSDELVKLDLGVHVNGWVGDNACTIDLSHKNEDLVKASRESLNNVVKSLKPGLTLNEVGEIVENTMSSYNVKSVRNLSGHTLGSYIVHGGTTIPNYPSGDYAELEEGLVIAIEPFATKGVGMIEEKGETRIFNLVDVKPVRVGFVKEILQYIVKTYRTLPFSKRALLLKFSEGQVNYSLNLFERMEILHKYPPLVERSGALVSQAEYTVLITKEGSEVLTKNSFSSGL